MKIIDFAKKGNVVRFYLGKDDLKDWTGDDWNDCPYEHNAGTVYDDYISGVQDMFFNYDCAVLEPADGVLNSDCCKDDMKARNVPCIIVVPAKELEKSWDHGTFSRWVANDRVKRFYFGDTVRPDEFD